MARIGIDLGTTNTVVGMLYDDGPHVVPRGAGVLIPSVVAYASPDAGETMVGEPADNYEAGGPVVRSIKRLMGRTYSEAKREGSDKYFPEGHGEVRLSRHGENGAGLNLATPGGGSRFVWPEQISAEILRAAKEHAEGALRVAVESAAVTVPAYFRDPHREATLEAARQAGLEVVGALLDEPTAAALAFARDVGFSVGEPILVADWGGGTLDVTVLVSNGPEWIQVAIDGELTLGGDDLDGALVDLAAARSRHSPEVVRLAENRRELRRAARRAKEILSERSETAFLCPRLIEPGTERRLPPLTFTLSRSEFEDATRTLLTRARACVERCLAGRDVARDEIRKVLLVGGSSQIPAFRQALEELLPHAELNHDVDPMKAVALGAAIYADKPPEIARICPFGYAYVHDDDTQTVVIPPGSEVPTSERSRFGIRAATAFQAQTIYRLKLVPFTDGPGGERTFFPERQRIFARGMPPTEMGRRVDVELWLDDNKTLKAQCHVQGLARTFPLEGSEWGSQELFTRLFDQQLDAEALVAANQNTAGGLLGDLRSAVALAEAAQVAKDREAAARSIEALSEIHVQFEAKREDAVLSGLMTPEQRQRYRVEGWLRFFEKEAVSRFAEAMDAQQHEEIKRAVRTLRLQLATGASAEELAASLYELEDAVFAGPARPALQAWHWASTAGVPPGAAQRLRTQALELRDALVGGNDAAAAAARQELEKLLAEVGESWKKWRATEAVLEAGADLRVLREAPPRGN